MPWSPAKEGQAAASQFGREGILNAGDLGGDGLHHTQGTRGLVFESMARRIASSSARETDGT